MNDNNIIQIDRKYLIDFYNRKLSALELADIYFENHLYSAANGFYIIHLDSLLDSQDFKTKSYCLSQMGLCYLYQQKVVRHNPWQLDIIHDTGLDSILLDPNNYVGWYCAGKSYEILNNHKKSYYYYSYIVMNLLDQVKPCHEKMIYDMIFVIFDLVSVLNIVKYDYFINKIMNWYINSKNYDFFKYVDLMNKIYAHKTSLSEDEKKIMNNSL